MLWSRSILDDVMQHILGAATEANRGVGPRLGEELGCSVWAETATLWEDQGSMMKTLGRVGISCLALF